MFHKSCIFFHSVVSLHRCSVCSVYRYLCVCCRFDFVGSLGLTLFTLHGYCMASATCFQRKRGATRVEQMSVEMREETNLVLPAPRKKRRRRVHAHNDNDNNSNNRHDNFMKSLRSFNDYFQYYSDYGLLQG